MNARQTVIAFLKAHQARDESQILRLCADDFRARGGPTSIVGAKDYLDWERQNWRELPTHTVVAENIVDSGNDVVVQWIDRSNSSGSQAVTTAGCSVFRVADGKVAEVYVYVDRSTIPADSLI